MYFTFFIFIKQNPWAQDCVNEGRNSDSGAGEEEELYCLIVLHLYDWKLVWPPVLVPGEVHYLSAVFLQRQTRDGITSETTLFLVIIVTQKPSVL